MAEIRKNICCQSITPLCFYVLFHISLYCPFKMSSVSGLILWLWDWTMECCRLGLFSPFSHGENELISRLACWSLKEDEGRVEQSQGLPVSISQSPEAWPSTVQISRNTYEHSPSIMFYFDLSFYLWQITAISGTISNNVNNNATHIIYIVGKD